jgi:hypothetical protein
MGAWFFIYLLFFHWVCDFPLQKNDWAINKSHDFIALLKHCATYAFSYGFFVWMFFFFTDAVLGIFSVVVFTLWMLLSHLVIDGISSRVNAYLFKNEMRKLFFDSIGFDQFLHYVTIFGFFFLLARLMEAV